jgi:DNA polymerase elongation subunit (family B)
MLLDYDKFILEKNNPCWKGYKQIGTKDKKGMTVPNCVKENSEINEEKETHKQFAENRLAGATKIAKSTKEKGGDALLTYHHYNVKLPYYQKRVDDKLNMEDLKKEYDNLLTDLYEATRKSMNITQVEFQELVGKIEVLGELLIENN